MAYSCTSLSFMGLQLVRNTGSGTQWLSRKSKLEPQQKIATNFAKSQNHREESYNAEWQNTHKKRSKYPRHTHTHTHTQMHTYPPTFPPSFPLCLSHLSYTVLHICSHSHIHTLTYPHTLPQYTHNTFSHTLLHIRSYTYTLLHMLTLSHFHTLTHMHTYCHT